MLNSQPDGAARVSLFSSVFWLVLGAAAFLFASAKLVLPEFLSGETLSYGRLSAVASVSLQYGWLALAGVGTIFYVLPRVTGSPMHSEKAGFVAVGLIDLTVLIGVAVNFSAGPQGHPFSELPTALYSLLVVATLMVAINVVRTVAARTESTLYASAWFFVGAAVWAPLAIIAGRMLPVTRVAGSIADLFGLNAVLNLWLASIGIGALYYLVPRATGAALYSHRLALIGFWTLAFLGPLTGQGRQIFGPGPAWLQTVSIAASIGLAIPVLCVVVNTFGTLAPVWDRVPSHPSVRFMVAGTVVWAVAMLQATVQGFRSISRAVGLTDWTTGQVWLLVMGAFTLWATGLIIYAIPRLMGRSWLSGTTITFHFWLTVFGIAGIALSSLAAGALTAAVFNAGVANQLPLSTGTGFDVVLSTVSRARVVAVFGAVMYVSGQVLFALNLFRACASGELRPIEVVQPVEAF